jgi:hypothetical protein
MRNQSFPSLPHSLTPYFAYSYTRPSPDQMIPKIPIQDTMDVDLGIVSL